jgi:hypothetical protein
MSLPSTEPQQKVSDPAAQLTDAKIMRHLRPRSVAPRLWPPPAAKKRIRTAKRSGDVDFVEASKLAAAAVWPLFSIENVTEITTDIIAKTAIAAMAYFMVTLRAKCLKSWKQIVWNHFCI